MSSSITLEMDLYSELGQVVHTFILHILSFIPSLD